MLKACVRSAAIRAPLLQPICLFSGNPHNAKLYSWLAAQGVKFIHHDPAWRDSFAQKLEGKDNSAHSHLYATADMQVRASEQQTLSFDAFSTCALTVTVASTQLL